MRLNGALKPHGAPYIGCSIGAKSYRDKRPQQQKPNNKYNNNHNTTLTASDQSNNKNNITTLPAAVNNNYFKRTPEYYPLTHDDDDDDDYGEDDSDVFINKQHNTSIATKMAPIISRAGKNSAAGRRRRRRPDVGVKHQQRHLMRVPQSLVAGLSSFTTLVLCLVCVLALLPTPVLCDDDSTETTTTEFDYAIRGRKKFGDKCEKTIECGFPLSICDAKKKSCQCVEDMPVTNHIDKCGKEAAVNESCTFNEECESSNFQTECRDRRCMCRFEMTPVLKDGVYECKSGNKAKGGTETYIDPAMIGVLVGMALMFVIICVVLRLFSQARWRENRTIFNTPNPRLMNVSLLRDSKLLHGQERRGSRMSVRAPSRQPSMASLRPHSPNPSLGKTGSRSGSGSNASATSVRSTRSNSVAPGAVNQERKSSTPHHHHHHQQPQQQPLITNITSNPVAENVTVEIIEPESK